MQNIVLNLESEDDKNILSVENIGILTFRFRSDGILVLNKILKVSDFERIDEISVENVQIWGLEHSNGSHVAQNYSIETEILKAKGAYIYDEKEKNPIPRRFLGNSHNFSVPHSLFYGLNQLGTDEKTENPFVFDVQMKEDNRQNSYKWVRVRFESSLIPKPLFEMDWNPMKLVLKYEDEDGEWQEKKVTARGNAHGHALLGIRFHITSTFETMVVRTEIRTRGLDLPVEEVTFPHVALENILISSDSGNFYEAQMTSLTKVSILTCNFRRATSEDEQEAIPFDTGIQRDRMFLCQKDAKDGAVLKAPLEEPEETLWIPETTTLKTSSVGTTSPIADETTEATTEVPRTTVHSESTTIGNKNRTKSPGKQKLKGKKKEEIVSAYFEGIQWCILVLTTLSIASFVAIFVLNYTRW